LPIEYKEEKFFLRQSDELYKKSFSTLPAFELELIIKNLPEMQKMKELVDNHLIKIQNTKNLSALQELFSSVLEKEKSKFSEKTSKQKAEMLFSAYREAFLIYLNKDSDFLKQLSLVQKGLKSDAARKVDQVVRNTLLSHMRTFHSLLIGQAIEKALGEDENTIKLYTYPDPYRKNGPGTISFFRFFKKESTPI
jgi:hypothetical protein